MRYVDELEIMRERAALLRREIALLLDDGRAQVEGDPDEAAYAAADVAIAEWEEQGEEQADLRAFRPLTPLEERLAEYQSLLDRIADMLDRRLS